MKCNYLPLTFRMLAGLFFFLGSLCFQDVHAQLIPDPGHRACTESPTCIINGDLNPNGPNPSGNMNLNAANTINGWYISHGTPSIWSGSPHGGLYGLWMWSYYGEGEGVFTCYRFQKGKKYEICFWVMNTSPVTAGNMMVYAANGLTPVPPIGFGGPVPTPASSQLISSSYVHSPTWTQVVYSFVPNADYNQLWIYPYMAGAPINYRAYEFAIDLIRVRDTDRQPSGLWISSDRRSISWCETANLCAGGSPSGNYYWSPATGLNTTFGPCVEASPCTTTTYMVETDDGNCASCDSKNSFTLEVIPPDVEAFSEGKVRCGSDFKLWATPDLPCVTYNWFDPQGNYVGSGQSISVSNASADMSGNFRVEVSYGGCTVIQYVSVEVVDCPCEFRAQFAYENCNPMFFSDASAGPGTSVSLFWEFGDGTTSTDQYPNHTYNSGGIYLVCLTVIRKIGNQTCCDRYCKEIEACKPPRQDEIDPVKSGILEPQPPAHNNNVVREESKAAALPPSDSKAGMTIVPNPAGDLSYVTVTDMDRPVVSLRNMNGTVLIKAVIQNDGRYILNLAGIPAGVYLVVAENASGQRTAKLVKN